MYSGTNKKNNLIAREARIGAFKIILQRHGTRCQRECKIVVDSWRQPENSTIFSSFPRKFYQEEFFIYLGGQQSQKGVVAHHFQETSTKERRYFRTITENKFVSIYLVSNHLSQCLTL